MYLNYFGFKTQRCSPILSVFSRGNDCWEWEKKRRDVKMTGMRSLEGIGAADCHGCPSTHHPLLPIPQRVPSPLFLILHLVSYSVHIITPILASSILLYLSYFHGINFITFKIYMIKLI